MLTQRTQTDFSKEGPSVPSHNWRSRDTCGRHSWIQDITVPLVRGSAFLQEGVTSRKHLCTVVQPSHPGSLNALRPKEKNGVSSEGQAHSGAVWNSC